MESFSFGGSILNTSKNKLSLKNDDKTCDLVIQGQTPDEPLAVTDVERKIIERKMRKKLAELPELTIAENSIALLSYEEIKRVSVCRVDNDKLSGASSVNDPQMG